MLGQATSIIWISSSIMSRSSGSKVINKICSNPQALCLYVILPPPPLRTEFQCTFLQSRVRHTDWICHPLSLPSKTSYNFSFFFSLRHFLENTDSRPWHPGQWIVGFLDQHGSCSELAWSRRRLPQSIQLYWTGHNGLISHCSWCKYQRPACLSRHYFYCPCFLRKCASLQQREKGWCCRFQMMVLKRDQ